MEMPKNKCNAILEFDEEERIYFCCELNKNHDGRHQVINDDWMLLWNRDDTEKINRDYFGDLPYTLICELNRDTEK